MMFVWKRPKITYKRSQGWPILKRSTSSQYYFFAENEESEKIQKLNIDVKSVKMSARAGDEIIHLNVVVDASNNDDVNVSVTDDAKGAQRRSVATKKAASKAKVKRSVGDILELSNLHVEDAKTFRTKFRYNSDDADLKLKADDTPTTTDSVSTNTADGTDVKKTKFRDQYYKPFLALTDG